MPQAKRILMGWEFGSGNGHVRQLKIIGERLAGEGLDVVYALRRPEGGLAVGIPADATKPAPNRALRKAPAGAPPETNSHSTTPPAGRHAEMTSGTYGDFLAQLMLGPCDDLTERLGRWHALLEAERPDLVIAHYAPGLSLPRH